MAKLFLMCGIPGSGKSTWAKNHLHKNAQYVSRDDIRFSYIAEGEEYFSREGEVWETFVKTINTNLELGYDTFADATHINPASRKKLLNQIKNYESVEAIFIDTPLSIALERNELRKDTERYVPRSVIRRMSSQLEEPTFLEGFSAIYVVRPDTKIEIRKEHF